MKSNPLLHQRYYVEQNRRDKIELVKSNHPSATHLCLHGFSKEQCLEVFASLPQNTNVQRITFKLADYDAETAVAFAQALVNSDTANRDIRIIGPDRENILLCIFVTTLLQHPTEHPIGSLWIQYVVNRETTDVVGEYLSTCHLKRFEFGGIGGTTKKLYDTMLAGVAKSTTIRELSLRNVPAESLMILKNYRHLKKLSLETWKVTFFDEELAAFFSSSCGSALTELHIRVEESLGDTNDQLQALTNCLPSSLTTFEFFSHEPVLEETEQALAVSLCALTNLKKLILYQDFSQDFYETLAPALRRLEELQVFSEVDVDLSNALRNCTNLKSLKHYIHTVHLSFLESTLPTLTGIEDLNLDPPSENGTWGPLRLKAILDAVQILPNLKTLYRMGDDDDQVLRNQIYFELKRKSLLLSEEKILLKDFPLGLYPHLMENLWRNGWFNVLHHVLHEKNDTILPHRQTIVNIEATAKHDKNLDECQWQKDRKRAKLT